MAGKASKNAPRHIAVEVCHSTLEAIVLDRLDGERVRARSVSLPWRIDARSLADELAVDELAAAFKKLAGDERLASPELHPAMSPDLCVTRVIVGRNDEVRHELRNVEDRCTSYLLLGGGQKSVGGCVRQVDAKVQHAMLAVVNRQALAHLVEAAAKAGVKPAVVEPALVAVCRLVGKQGIDAQSPVLIVQATERGAEAGLSYQGQLLLEYRPAARMPREQVPAVLARHLGRLQRYCERYVRFTEGKIGRVVLCGEPEAVRQLQSGMAAEIKVPVEVLAAPTCDGRWEYEGQMPGPWSCGALGVALRVEREVAEQATPNLLARLHAQTREPVLPVLAKTLWPVAAALAIGTTGWGAVLWKHIQCRAVERQIARYEPSLQRGRILRGRSVHDVERMKELQHIASEIDRPGWDAVAATIAKCLPDDVWLETVRADGQGHLELVGASHTTDGVYEFIRWLRQYPSLAHVAVGGTRTTRQQSGPVTEFEIHCELAGHGEPEEGDNGSD